MNIKLEFNFSPETLRYYYFIYEKILGGCTMKNKKTELENRTITSESGFDIVGCIYAISYLIQVLHQAGII
ncbi:hypothetical protein [Bacillus pretiosus]|uniref:hypothetical protein n=1 Tax=Bacillus pretiosus TaxID=2983392 RepID=UPI002EDB595B